MGNKNSGRYKPFIFKVNDNGCFECISHSKDKNGYPKIGRHENEKIKYYRLSRYLWEKYKGEIPKEMFVCHKCDNPKCCNINHLFLGTAKDNAHDMIKKGRQTYLKGEDCGQAKLTKEQAAEIRNRTESLTVLANEFNVCRQTIANIKNNVCFKDENKPEIHRSRKKIKDEDIQKILKDTRTHKDIAIEYNVTPHQIWAIKKRKYRLDT